MKIVMYIPGHFCPIKQGSDRLLFEMARELNVREDVELTLVVNACSDQEHELSYRQLCKHLVWIEHPRKWGFVDILNKVVARCGFGMLIAYFVSLGMRKQFVEICQDADRVILNYAIWFPLLPQKLRREKGVVNTIDINFYRRDSFCAPTNLIKRFMSTLNRNLELRILRSFGRIVVLADYERDILVRYGIPRDIIIRLGLPVEKKSSMMLSNVKKEYDFLLIGGNSYQNEAGVFFFFEKIAPLLAHRSFIFAVAGGICNSAIWKRIVVPKNVSLQLLGYVDNLDIPCSKALIGVGTVPYGSGIKVKVVEMAMNGLPIVCTDHGEEGIPTFAEATINVDRVAADEVRCRLEHWLDCPMEAAEVGRRQGQLVRDEFNPARCIGRLLAKI